MAADQPAAKESSEYKRYPHDLGTAKKPIPGATLAAKEKYLLEHFPLLRFRDFLKKNCPDKETFISNFWEWSNKYITVNATKSSEEVCESGRMRSLVDIFLIYKYYVPDGKLADLKMLIAGSEGSFCGTVERVVYEEGTPIMDDETDEFGFGPYGFVMAK